MVVGVLRENGAKFGCILESVAFFSETTTVKQTKEGNKLESFMNQYHSFKLKIDHRSCMLHLVVLSVFIPKKKFFFLLIYLP